MRYIDPASACLLAIAPAIVVAAFAGRSRCGTVRTILLVIAALPSLAFAYVLVCPLGHHVPAIAALVIGSGLVLVPVAFGYGRTFSAGWGLAWLAGMASLPLILFVAAILYGDARNGSTQPERRRDLSYPEQLERDRKLAIEDRQRRAAAQRETIRLRKCARTLSMASGKASARKDRAAGRRQFVLVGTFGQQTSNEWFPGLSGADYSRYKLTARSTRGGIAPLGADAESFEFQAVDPPYPLWNDPWGARLLYMSPNDIRRCDEAVLAYAVGYNQTMRMPEKF